MPDKPAADSTTLSDVVARLDTLNATLTRIAIALEARPAAAAAASSPAKGAAPTPPLKAATPPKPKSAPKQQPKPQSKAATKAAAATGVAAVAVAAAAGGARPAGADTGDEAPSGPAADAPVHAVVVDLFGAALIDDKEACWERLVALTYSGDLEAPRALDNLKAFSWKRLRKNVDRYLEERDPRSFQIVRTMPADPPEQADRVKVFLGSKVGSPAPISLRRDAAAGGAWRITNVSL